MNSDSLPYGFPASVLGATKLGIFGGAFNPPHLWHTQIAQHAIRELSLDALLVIPTWTSPHKNISWDLSYDSRILLTEIAFRTVDPYRLIRSFSRTRYNSRIIDSLSNDYRTEYESSHNDLITVSIIEKDRSPSYTIDTIRMLHSINPLWEIHIIVGADQAAAFNTWREWQNLSASTSIIAYDRPRFDRARIVSTYPFIRFIDAPVSEISSSDLRAKIDEGKSTAGLIDPFVERSIRLIRV